jgi:hypothetical protein
MNECCSRSLILKGVACLFTLALYQRDQWRVLALLSELPLLLFYEHFFVELAQVAQLGMSASWADVTQMKLSKHMI